MPHNLVITHVLLPRWSHGFFCTDSSTPLDTCGREPTSKYRFVLWSTKRTNTCSGLGNNYVSRRKCVLLNRARARSRSCYILAGKSRAKPPYNGTKTKTEYFPIETHPGLHLRNNRQGVRSDLWSHFFNNAPSVPPHHVPGVVSIQG